MVAETWIGIGIIVGIGWFFGVHKDCQREIEWLRQMADSEIFKQAASPI